MQIVALALLYLKLSSGLVYITACIVLLGISNGLFLAASRHQVNEWVVFFPERRMLVYRLDHLFILLWPADRKDRGV